MPRTEPFAAPNAPAGASSGVARFTVVTGSTVSAAGKTDRGCATGE